jgi:hypothetical protein
VTLLVASVIATLVYDTCASCRLCPGGQLMSEGGGLIVSDAVTCPFLPELNCPVSLTGPATVVLFEALGLPPPRLTHIDAHIGGGGVGAGHVGDELVGPQAGLLEGDGQGPVVVQIRAGPDEVLVLRERLLGNEGEGHKDQRHYGDLSLHLLHFPHGNDAASPWSV